MKINKACDLSSISVFPPPLLHSRKANNVSSGLQVSHSQHRTQPSQQSFSQGLSSQHGLLSHFSQNSLDEAVTTNEPRVGSQEQENSLRRLSSLPRPTYSREESHPLNSRSSSNLMLKWNSADHKGQLSEGLEHRIGIMETSLSRFAMILDSVQSDVMQVNKGTKEIILEVECIRQKLIAQDNSFQLMTKGQEEFKARIDGNLKSLSEQMSHVSKKEKLQDVYLAVSPLPRLIEASMQSVKNDLCNITKEMQGISSNLRSFNQKNMAPPSLSLKNLSKQVITPKKRQPLAKEANTSLQAAVAPEVEMGGWKSVKKERVTFSDKASEKVQKKKEPQTEKFMKGGIDCAIVIESDEETEVGFSCLVKENAGRSGEDLFGKLTKEEEEETERILRKARRRKRKSIVIL
ncbi:putative recombination initiation defects 3 [Vigna umbellata]|uniref:putative recombination initiation defects 3 n=1 Tax=Vigna umbellata TaxID=87088 RepID=UPI001F5EAA47|nr:putative recombination initiation defects 3 [Vigna umbellata]